MCAFKYGGERCNTDALPTFEGGKCMHCHKNFCRDHLVPTWHMCGWKWNEKTKTYDTPEYAT